MSLIHPKLFSFLYSLKFKSTTRGSVLDLIPILMLWKPRHKNVKGGKMLQKINDSFVEDGLENLYIRCIDSWLESEMLFCIECNTTMLFLIIGQRPKMTTCRKHNKPSMLKIGITTHDIAIINVKSLHCLWE